MAKKTTYRLPEATRLAVIDVYKQGNSIEAVAKMIGLPRSTVGEIVTEVGISRTRKPPAQKIKARSKDVPPVTRKAAENDNAPAVAVHPIMATEGRWAALAAYAASCGITTAKAQQMWHKARAGVLV